MARPEKTGLDYFPFDVDFFQDIKVRKLIRYQGGRALPVYMFLLCRVYEAGYYLRWDTDLPFIISEATGYEESYVNEVIDRCADIGLFSADLFRQKEILTSKGIQERYRAILQQLKRRVVISEFNLVNAEKTRVNSEETQVNSEETPVNSVKSTQRKEKEIKEKKREEDDGSSSASISTEIPDFFKANNQRLAEEMKKDPPELRPPPLTMAEYGEKLRSNRQYVETACMTRKVSEQEFNQVLTEFVAEKTVLEHVPKNLRDVQQHFLNYLQKWREKQSNNRLEDKVGGKIRQTVEATVKAAAEIEDEGGYFTYQDIHG